MRVKWLVAFVTITAALPLGAQADASRATKPDLWVSADGNRGAGAIGPWDRSAALSVVMQDPVAAPGLVALDSAPKRDPARLGPWLSHSANPVSLGPIVEGHGGFEVHAALGSVRDAPLGRMPTGTSAPAVNSVPEMNRGLAAAGLTLLLGGIAVLRSRRSGMPG